MAQTETDEPPTTMAELLASSGDGDWRPLDPDNTLYLDLGRRRVVIELAPHFAPRSIANIKRLLERNYWDGLAVVRVDDNYVVQWADPDVGDPALRRSMDPVGESLVPELDRPIDPRMNFTPLGAPDLYAESVGFIDGFPVARDVSAGRTWLIHSYGAVGIGRDNDPDSGNGSELYAVIGHAPRQLDRNVALIGRVRFGMEHLSSLPRGEGPMGFYTGERGSMPILTMRLASKLPDAERLSLEVLRTDTRLFRRLIEARRNRNEPWFVRQAGHIDIANVPLPVRLRA